MQKMVQNACVHNFQYERIHTKRGTLETQHVWMWWWKAQGRYQRRYLVYGLSKSTMVNHWWIIGTYWSKNELIAVTKISPTWKVQPTNNGKYHKSMEVWKWLLYGKWLPIVIKIHYHSTKNYIWSYLPLPEMVFTINRSHLSPGNGRPLRVVRLCYRWVVLPWTRRSRGGGSPRRRTSWVCLGGRTWRMAIFKTWTYSFKIH